MNSHIPFKTFEPENVDLSNLNFAFSHLKKVQYPLNCSLEITMAHMVKYHALDATYKARKLISQIESTL